MGPMRVLNNLRHAMSHKKGVNKFRKLASKVVKAKTKGINAATLIFDHQKRSRVLGVSTSSRCQSVGTAEGGFAGYGITGYGVSRPGIHN